MTAALADVAYRRSDTGAREPIPVHSGMNELGACLPAPDRKSHTQKRHGGPKPALLNPARPLTRRFTRAGGGMAKMRIGAYQQTHNQAARRIRYTC